MSLSLSLRDIILRFFDYPDGFMDEEVLEDGDSPFRCTAPSLSHNPHSPPGRTGPHPIIVCVDVEGALGNSISEVGISVFDTVDVRETFGSKGEPREGPGTRAHKWFKHIKTTHIRIKNTDHLRTRYCPAKPEKFGFRTSVDIELKNLKPELDRRFKNIQHLRLTSAEIKNGKKRNIILAVWDAQLERRLFKQYGLGWFNQCYKVWDIQKMETPMAMAADLHGKNAKLSLRNALESLGIQYGDLLHNGGNDSALELQCMLAFTFITLAEEKELRAGSMLPDLPLSWREQNVKRNESLHQPSVAPLSKTQLELLNGPQGVWY